MLLRSKIYGFFCFVTLLGVSSCEISRISFSEFCRNDTNPGIIPNEGSTSSGIFFLSDKNFENISYEPGLNCSVTLSVKDGYKLLVVFTRVNLRNSSMDTLKVIHDGESSILSGQHECPGESCKGLMFESGKNTNMTFEFHSANYTVPSSFTGFKAVYTVFDLAGKDGRCKGKKRFLCLNGHCIAKELACNGHNNCGDMSDETLFCSLPWSKKVWACIVIAIAVFSIAIFVPIFCFLAKYGTQPVVKAVTLPNKATPLYSAVEDGETTHLLTSSGAPSGYWSSGTYDRRHTYTGDCLFQAPGGEPSTSDYQRSHSVSDRKYSKTAHS